MKAYVTTPDTYGLKKSNNKHKEPEYSILKTVAQVYKGWIPKAYYKMTIPGIEHIHTKSRQKIASIPTTPPISDAVSLLWLADSDGAVLGIERFDGRSDEFLVLIRSPANELSIQHWEHKAKKGTTHLNGHDSSYIPVTFLYIPALYLILDTNGCINIYSEAGNYVRTFSSITNPVVGLARTDNTQPWQGIEQPVIVISHLFGDIKFFTVNSAGEFFIYNCLQSNLFAPHRLTTKNGYLFIANRSSQYGIINLETRSGVYFGATIAPIVDICIACESTINTAFCLLTENSRLIVIILPTKLLKKSVSSNILVGDLLKATTHTFIFGRSEEYTPTSLAAIYNNSIVTVFITVSGGHIYMRRLGVLHELTTTGSLSTFKLDSDALSFLHVSRSIPSNIDLKASYSQLITEALSQPRGSLEKATTIQNLIKLSDYQSEYYVIEEDIVTCSSLTGLSGREEPLNFITILSETQKDNIYWILGIATSPRGLLIWFRLPLLLHDLKSDSKNN